MFANSTKAPGAFMSPFLRAMGRLGGKVWAQAMQRNWLLRKYVNPTNPPSLRPLTGSEEPEKKPMKALQSPRSAAK